MKISIIKFLILSIVFSLSACHAPIKCKTSIALDEPKSEPIILLDTSAPVLYSADFKVLKYHFSGLIAFRKMNETKETRIVFLTETGIRMMEFSYANNIIENTYCVEAVKKKSTIKFVGSFLQMLLIIPECKKSCKIEADTANIYFCKTKRCDYYYTLNNGVRECVLAYYGKKKFARSKYSVSAKLPDEILLKMPMKSNIQMNKVNNAFK